MPNPYKFVNEKVARIIAPDGSLRVPAQANMPRQQPEPLIDHIIARALSHSDQNEHPETESEHPKTESEKFELIQREYCEAVRMFKRDSIKYPKDFRVEAPNAQTTACIAAYIYGKQQLACEECGKDSGHVQHPTENQISAVRIVLARIRTDHKRKQAIIARKPLKRRTDLG